MLRRVIPLLAISLICLSVQAEDLRLKPEVPLLQARVNLLSGDASSGGSRLLGAQLLGDYYLAGSGLRLSGGLLMGPNSLIASGLAPASRGLLGVGHRRLLGSGLNEELSHSQTYLGLGYSRYGEGWGFSADLGVAVSGNASGLRLGGSSAFASSLDDTLRRLRWTPVLQFGVNYRF